MKYVILIAFVLISVHTEAQTNFEKGMTKAFDLWKVDKIDEAENLFERIANAEKEEWLPHYYIAQINSLKSWNVKDEALLKAQLDKAQVHLSAALSMSENNAELLVMQAQIYTNWISYDGMTYGMKYAAKVTELYNKASQLEPKNPRVALCKADWAMGSAKYFGKDTAPFCKEIEEAIILFDSFKAQSAFHPKWGKKRANAVLKSCKDSN